MPKTKEEYNAYMAEYMLKRYHKRRALGVEKLGGKCTECGSLENLEFDHKVAEEKSFPVSKLWSVAEAKFWAELEKCQLLCTECHQKKTRYDVARIRGIRPYAVHGTISMRRYCDCAECKKAIADWNREYKKNRKPS